MTVKGNVGGQYVSIVRVKKNLWIQKMLRYEIGEESRLIKIIFLA